MSYVCTEYCIILDYSVRLMISEFGDHRPSFWLLCTYVEQHFFFLSDVGRRKCVCCWFIYIVSLVAPMICSQSYVHVHTVHNYLDERDSGPPNNNLESLHRAIIALNRACEMETRRYPTISSDQEKKNSTVVH